MDNQTKGERRENQARKQRNGAYMGVRTPTARAGEGLIKWEVARKTRKGKGK